MTRSLVMFCDVDLDRPDGARSHTIDLARAFVAGGATVDLIARGADPGLAGVTYHSAAAGPVPTLQRIRRANTTAVRVLGRRRRAKPGVYVRMQWGSAPTVAAARMMGLVVVAEVNDLPYGRDYPHAPGTRAAVANRVKPVLAAIVCRGASRVVAITEALRGIVVGDYGVPAARVVTIPVGVDASAVTPRQRTAAQRRVGLHPELRYAVFVGAFAPWVAFDTLLDGFGRAAQSMPQARLVLVGDGPRRDEVSALIASHGLTERVLMTGFVADRDQVLDYVASASVCALAHRVDRLGRTGASPAKLAEYIASGRAVVATELPGVADMIRACGAGTVVAEGDTDAYAAALLSYLNDPASADATGRAARAVVAARYGWDVAAARIMALFEG